MPEDTQKLTVSREAMVAHIEQNGGSVLVNGALITRTANLPTVADFAAKSGNPALIDSALDSLDAALAVIQAQKDALLAKGNAAAPPPPPKPLPDMQEPRDLLKLSFSQALTVAQEQGVEDIDSYETKADLVDAILVKTGYQPLQGPAGPIPPGWPVIVSPPAPEQIQEPVVGIKADASTATPSQDEIVAQLGSLTVDQLKAVATESGIGNVASLSKKQDLIDAIVARGQSAA